jgi:hypothetical protein
MTATTLRETDDLPRLGRARNATHTFEIAICDLRFLVSAVDKS